MIDKSSLLKSQGSLYLKFIPKDGLLHKMLLLSLMNFKLVGVTLTFMEIDKLYIISSFSFIIPSKRNMCVFINIYLANRSTQKIANIFEMIPDRHIYVTVDFGIQLGSELN